MKEKTQNYSIQVAKICDHLMSIISSKFYTDQDLTSKEPYKYLYTILFKTNNALETANILTCNIVNKPNTTDSIFLILRTILSDLIIYYCLVSKSANDEDFEKNIHSLYFDHISYTVKEMKNFNRSAYKQSEEKNNEDILKFKANYPHYFFNEDGTDKVEKPAKWNVSFLVKKHLTEQHQDNNLDILIRAKKLYDKFSKYEHFGILTQNLIHRSFEDKQLSNVFEDIFWANKIILFFIDDILRFWLDNNNSEYLKFNSLSQEITDSKWINQS